MQESVYDWASFWDEQTEDFLEGVCFAEDTVFYEHEYRFSQHAKDCDGLVYVFDELGEEE